MCVDIHPRHPHMLACGLHDGNVAVYNLHKMRLGGKIKDKEIHKTLTISSFFLPIEMMI